MPTSSAIARRDRGHVVVDAVGHRGEVEESRRRQACCEPVPSPCVVTEAVNQDDRPGCPRRARRRWATLPRKWPPVARHCDTDFHRLASMPTRSTDQ